MCALRDSLPPFLCPSFFGASIPPITASSVHAKHPNICIPFFAAATRAVRKTRVVGNSWEDTNSARRRDMWICSGQGCSASNVLGPNQNAVTRSRQLQSSERGKLHNRMWEISISVHYSTYVQLCMGVPWECDVTCPAPIDLFRFPFTISHPCFQRMRLRVAVFSSPTYRGWILDPEIR